MIGYYLTGFSTGLGVAVVVCLMVRIACSVREVSDDI